MFEVREKNKTRMVYFILNMLKKKLIIRPKIINLLFLRHRRIMSNTAALINFIHILQREITQFNIFPS
jgi:hypothetical protein